MGAWIGQRRQEVPERQGRADARTATICTISTKRWRWFAIL